MQKSKSIVIIQRLHLSFVDPGEVGLTTRLLIASRELFVGSVAASSHAKDLPSDFK